MKGGFIIMENFIAIFIAVATFIFTIYQWLVTMNTRRPHLIVQGFKPAGLKISNEYNYLQVFLPKDWFVINLSEIPNTLIGMDLYAKIDGKWVEGKFIYYNLWDISSKEKFKPPFPVGMSGHSYFMFEESKQQVPLIFEFEGLPSVQELEKLNLSLRLHDQFGKTHVYYFSRPQHFPKVDIWEHPDLYWSSDLAPEILADINVEDSKGELTIVRVVYMPKYTVNYEITPCLGILASWRYGTSECATMSRRDMSSWQECKEPVVIYKENFIGYNTNSRMLLHLESSVPKAVEIECTVAGGEKISEKIDLPEDFIRTLRVEKEKEKEPKKKIRKPVDKPNPDKPEK